MYNDAKTLKEEWERIKVMNLKIRESIQLQQNPVKREKLLKWQDKSENTDNQYYSRLIAEAERIESIGNSTMSIDEKIRKIDFITATIHAINEKYDIDSKALHNELMEIQKEKD